MTGRGSFDGAAGIFDTWRAASVSVKAMLAGLFVNRLGQFVQIFLVLYMTSRGFTATEGGVALGVYGAGMVLGTLLGGWLTDEIGARGAIIISTIGTAISAPVVLYLGSYVAILPVLALAAAAAQAFQPASTSILSELTSAERQVMIFAMCRLAMNIGASAAPLLGAILAQVSYSFLFWGEAASAIALCIIAVTTLPAGRFREADKIPDKENSDGDDTHGGYLAVITDCRYLLFLAAMFASSAVYIQFLAMLPLTVRNDGFSTTTYGGLIAINGITVVVCGLSIARAVQAWQPRMAIIAGVILTAGGMSFYGVHWGFAGLIIATLIWTLGEMIGSPTQFFAYPAQAGPPRLRGRYLGASNASYALACAIGPAVGVALWSRIGDAAWGWCGALGLVAAAAAWGGVHRVRPRRSPPPDRVLELEDRAT